MLMIHAMHFHFKNSLPDQNAIASGGSVYSHVSSQDIGSKSFKHPNLTEANIQQSDTDLTLCSRVYKDESSLGLSGINWTESLGPFDLGLSSRKVFSANDISIDGIVK
ncbi:uncharacterized protein LOC120125559 [Hibiscus syriacus]|uniref:uncharacterized protein LOC120125559 n=1 Tax=Hibiscus syriacus TaxID=106335 RepID=UPI00192500D3|nr:uncharacterized protein LOC120125559 [Hibiscus syriacus]XP_038999896.1 uncharacterized protein LOC120125559 [Hibiscus syriacus]